MTLGLTRIARANPDQACRPAGCVGHALAPAGRAAEAHDSHPQPTTMHCKPAACACTMAGGPQVLPPAIQACAVLPGVRGRARRRPCLLAPCQSRAARCLPPPPHLCAWCRRGGTCAAAQARC